jgi:TonB-dependent receptor
MKVLKNFCCLLLVIVTTSFVSVKAEVVLLSGKLLDAQTNSPIVGAVVKIEKESKTYTTDVEGRFIIKLESGKKYTIVFSSLGYASKEVADVSVDAKNNTLDVSLAKAAKELGEVTVKSSSKKETAASLYALQKNSSSISDGISSEVIKKSPDKNIGDVLKRVSGASVQDNKFVVVRGLNERYNVSLLNNSVLPSTEPDKKAFSFDIIPSSLIDNLLIYKSPTSDLPGDFSGGAIKISTKDYPSRKLAELSVNVSFNSLTTFQNFYTGFPEGNTDFLGFTGKSRQIPSSYTQYGSSFILQSDATKTNVTKQFPNTYGSQAGYKSYPNINVSYLGGNTKVLNNNRKLGYIYSLSYTTERKVSERVRNEYQDYQQQLYDYNTKNYDQKAKLSALLNLSYSYNKSKISWKNLFNNDFSKLVGRRNGVDNSFDPVSRTQPFLIKSENSEIQQNGLFNSVVEGVHALPKASWTIDWNASYGYAYRLQPDQKIIAFRTNVNTVSPFYIKLNNENSPEIRNAGRVYSDLKESIYGANANAVKSFQWMNRPQKVKLGFSTYYRDRKFDVNALGYSSLISQRPYGVTIQESKDINFKTIFNEQNIDTYNLTVANIATNSISYTANSFLTAGYAMFDGSIAEKLKLTAGARVENYSQTLKSLNQPDVKPSNFDVLPSALITYSLNTKTNLRLAGSQSVNRPEFRELAINSAYDYDNNYTVRGNPSLVRSKNTNADLRYEFFPGAGEIISVSGFYKYFDKPIEQVNLGNDVYGYQNADKATVYGAELEVRKKMDFVKGRFFENVTLYANLAYMDGSVSLKDISGNTINTNSSLQGQSPYLINGGISYSSRGDDFSVNLLYNRIGSRLKFRGSIASGGWNIFEKPRDLIDLQITKKILKDKLELKLTVSDILAQPFVWYYKFDANPSTTSYKESTDRIISSTKYGTTTYLSLRWKIN